MQIDILCVGKIKEKYFRDALEEYKKRLSRYCKINEIEVPDEKTPVLSDAMRDLTERAMAYSPDNPLYVVSIAAIKFLMSYIKKHNFKPFGWYRIVIGLLVLCTNPIGSHTIAKGAYKAGIRPEKKMEVDDLGRDFDE